MRYDLVKDGGLKELCFIPYQPMMISHLIGNVLFCYQGVSDKGPSHPPESSWGAYDKTRFQYR
jgi:hypothetical protein